MQAAPGQVQVQVARAAPVRTQDNHYCQQDSLYIPRSNNFWWP